MLAILALATAFAAQAPAARPAEVVPMTVEVQAPASAGPAVEAWGRELRTALEARKGEFRLVKAGRGPELVVRIDSVGDGQNGSQVMNGALVLGKVTRPFNLTYASDTRTQAEALARNLRKYADQMKATGR
jgi:hypothetical protein